MADPLHEAISLAPPPRTPAGSQKPPTIANSSEMAEPDTCRICRGEATADEPLFYPCKCSGTIKFVHQDCLMEWLSHSQKKHCDLCKTPFRFTKLYDRRMPKTIPFRVFVTHMARYMLDNVLVYLRGALVFSMWLVWLPYLMRSIWSLMFWVSDEGFGGGHTSVRLPRDVVCSATDLGRGVCPASPLFAARATGDAYTMLLPSLSLLNPFVSPVKFNFSTFPPTVDGHVMNLNVPIPTPNSLLSNIGWLRNLTRHPIINRNVIYVLEGQIITVLVILSFILIILVRDYVVLQQPEINMRAAFAAENQPRRIEAGDAVVVEEPDDPVPNAPAEGIEENENLEEADDDDASSWQPDQGSEAGHSEEEVGSNLPPPEPKPLSPSLSIVADYGSDEGSSPEDDMGLNQDNSHQRGPDTDDVEPLTTREFTRLYHEAQGDMDVVMTILRERGLEARAERWLKLRKDWPGQANHLDRRQQEVEPSIAEASSAHPASPTSESSSNMSTWTDAGLAPADKGNQRDTDITDDPVDVPAQGLSPPSIDKGKARAQPLNPEPTPRPRANTDGQYRSEGLHPLANNSWSFQMPPDVTQSPWAAYGHSQDSGASQSSPGQNTPTTGDLELAPEDVPEQLENPQQHELPDDTERQPAEEWANLPDFNDIPVDRAPRVQPDVGIMGHLMDFMWNGVDAGPEVDPAQVRALIEAVRRDDDSDSDQEDDEVNPQNGAGAGDAGREGNAPAPENPDEAIEIDEAEDFEGVMELLGMRGPIAGLFQNAIFCAFLVSVTVFAGIFIPYNIGRICFWIIANPTRPLRILFSAVKLVQDVALVFFGLSSWFTLRIVNTIFQGASLITRRLELEQFAWTYVMPLVRAAYYLLVDSARSVSDTFTTEAPVISTTEMRNFSAVSHDALLSIKATIGWTFSALGQAIVFVLGGNYSTKTTQTISFLGNATASAWTTLQGVPAILTNPSSWVINLSSESTVAINPELASWSGADRVWAVLGGYLALCLVAALYLHRGRPFSTSQAGQDREASIIDVLNQASGVMKVILIIGIEMLIFPLYCGLLLDVALLPLFENTTLKSRMLFTYNYPLTSIFVHWFVGTGYMFHFALFVSMCRKIMRKGVLYFIRDPDDPEFHPVRDVLERNVTTQLRKILFSAFVYGALVIVCLGGVVWGLWLCLPSVLPIHYSSNEPVLEFPIDLLFYNFLMPLALSFFRPSDGLHSMYTWCFRKCARALRVTWFLFGERRIDEEGILELAPGSKHWQLPLWRRLFLELNKDGEVVPKTWHDVFDGGDDKPAGEMAKDKMDALISKKEALVKSKQIVPDGRFVCAPASDQVKIAKGKRVFLDMPEPSLKKGDPVVISKRHQLVYVPPNFRLRVFLFILFIWIFAAVTGVGFTIIPLVFGRLIFKMLIPVHIRTNDIYAFSIGIYIVGSAAYGVLNAPRLWKAAKAWVRDHTAVGKAIAGVKRGARLVYAYTFSLVVFPLMVATLMELYLLIPLDTYMYSAIFEKENSERHTIRVVQSWTIGLLYLKLATRVITSWYGDTRLALAVRAVWRRGLMNPDVGVLTRAFVLPGIFLCFVAIAWPLCLCRMTLGYLDLVDHPLATTLYRLSYPMSAVWVGLVCVAMATWRVFKSWRVRIRDEAYLIGERLHNFGASQPHTGGPHNPRGRMVWREGGGRVMDELGI